VPGILAGLVLLSTALVAPGQAKPDVISSRVAPRLSWASIGPQPITGEYWSGGANASGRVSSIAVDHTNPSIVYAGVAAGGLWKTTDGGVTWAALTDQIFYPISGAVTIDPSNHLTVYYGTGDYDAGVPGNGLFRSLDGGLSWTRIAAASEVGAHIARVVVHPTNPLVVHVAGSSGTCRTTNGGAGWLAFQLDDVSDLVLNSASPATLYCGRRDVGIFRSTDGGATWNPLTNGLPTSGVRRINLDLCQSSPQTLYAGIINSSNGLLGFYASGDGGATWARRLNTPNYPFPLGWFSHFVTADPANALVAYAGGVFPTYAPAGAVKTTNGGISWSDITISTIQGQIHPNQHCLAVGPDGTLWVGSDGGVWKSSNAGASWINCNGGLATAQINQIALHPTDPSKLLAGTRDNGTIERTSDSMAWPQLFAGDGGFSAYDAGQPSRRYTTYSGLRVFRFVFDAYEGEITGPWTLTDPVASIAPLVNDPSNPRALLGGTNRVWRTLDASLPVVAWTPMSAGSIAGAGVLTAIAVSPRSSNVIYAGGSFGTIFRTTDGVTWMNRSNGLPPGERITDIAIDPANSDHVFVSTSEDVGGRVLESADAGASWNARDGSLAVGLYGESLAVDWGATQAALYLGTAIGVYASYDGGANWIKDSLNLPNVVVSDLSIDATRRTLTAGTLGRSAWRTSLPCEPGDLNMDGVVDSADIPAFVAVVVGGSPTSPLRCAADISLDGLVDGKDIQLMVGLVLSHD